MTTQDIVTDEPAGSPDFGDGPTVLLLSTEGVLTSFYRDQLPPGWRLETLSSLHDDEEAIRKAQSAHAIVDTSRPVTRAHLEAATNLMLVQRQGVGIDSLDIDALRDNGVPVATCPDGALETVAEHAVMLMLAAGRHLIKLHTDVTKRGRWPKWDYRQRSVGLRDATVGIVGFGGIGQRTAKLILAFGADVLVYRRPGRPDVGGEWPAGRVANCHSLGDLFSSVEVVSLHCPLTSDNAGMVNASLLQRMPPNSVFVNTARGGLVVEDDLVAALREGPLLAAGLDCLADEPPKPDNPLLSLPNVVLTPHVATGTRQAQAAKARAVLDNIARVWAGQEPLNRVL